tara:strand:+ start:140 stop:706 length:567 start_codon:yes stop_codon:yes gene_type:complete
MKSFNNQIINGIDHQVEIFELADYEACTFSNCDFSKVNLTKIKFIDCDFNDCNFSEVIINDTFFQEVRFVACKMMGLNFDNCNDFGFQVCFEACILNYSSFFKVRLKNTTFDNCKLVDVDFSETDLTNALFDNCDLTNALFDRSVLLKTNFKTAYNYSIDPENNKIKGAQFSLPQVTGLLNKYSISIG